MKEKIEYADEPMGNVRVVADFLPSSEKLVLKDDAVDVTLSLSKSSLDFFKSEARKRNLGYQQMIRKLLDEYAAHHS